MAPKRLNGQAPARFETNWLAGSGGFALGNVILSIHLKLHVNLWRDCGRLFRGPLLTTFGCCFSAAASSGAENDALRRRGIFGTRVEAPDNGPRLRSLIGIHRVFLCGSLLMALAWSRTSLTSSTERAAASARQAASYLMSTAACVLSGCRLMAASPRASLRRRLHHHHCAGPHSRGDIPSAGARGRWSGAIAAACSHGQTGPTRRCRSRG